MTSYQLKTQTIYCGDNLKMLKDIPDESIGFCFVYPYSISCKDISVFLDMKPILF